MAPAVSSLYFHGLSGHPNFVAIHSVNHVCPVFFHKGSDVAKSAKSGVHHSLPLMHFRYLTRTLALHNLVSV